MSSSLKKTPLYDFHKAKAGKMIEFSGYAMPMHYESGIFAEHRLCRFGAALFDVSHMGQAFLKGPKAVKVLEGLTPADIVSLREGHQKYALFTNEKGGILDDFIVARQAAESFFIVVNAACKDADFARIQAALPTGTVLEIMEDRALLALQGPKAALCLSALNPDITQMHFMDWCEMTLGESWQVYISRSGYTGEDGFEISIKGEEAVLLAERLLATKECGLSGLGARDTLRLEAGLCLYGADLDCSINPIEANLDFTVGKKRKIKADFPGGAVIKEALEKRSSVKKVRVGFKIEGRSVPRKGCAIVFGTNSTTAKQVGIVTSGTFSPTLGTPIAMGYILRKALVPISGQEFFVIIRGKSISAKLISLPFVPHNYAV